jgi:hypothetical protein
MRLSCWHRCACTHRRRVSSRCTRLRTNGCAFARALVSFIHATQAPPTPSRAVPQRTLTAPARRCSRTSSHRRQVRPLPTVAAADSACRYERWSVTSGRRPLRRAKLWWSFLPTRALRRNQYPWTLRRMRTKACFNVFRVALKLFRPLRSCAALPLPGSHLALPTCADSSLGRFKREVLFRSPFVLRPTPTSRLSLSHSHSHLCTRSCSYRGSSCAAHGAEGVPRPGRPPTADGAAASSVRRKPRDRRRGVHAIRRVPHKQRANNATCRTMFHAKQHQSWRARRRYAATIGALAAQNAKLVAENTELATQNSALTAENSKLAAQCGAAVVDASATSEASLQEGNARARAHARAFCAYSEYPVCPANPERT